VADGVAVKVLVAVTVGVKVCVFVAVLLAVAVLVAVAVGISVGLTPSKGFEIIPFRWIVERIFAWISKNGRFSKDYEVYIATSVGMIQLTMIKIMLKRLAA